ncbi:MAG: MotA/TolQ/ExbB proton channel family protein, partial [Gammaproteobacteria bacterium]|nr:MotA/TolQ/ExbB proton channel family protein [Gammaproteobacteria bacterium]
MRRLISFIIISLCSNLALMNVNAAGKAASLDQLLQQVQQGKFEENKANKKREAEFKRNKSRQAQLLANAKKERADEEARSARMEGVFDINEGQIADLTETLTKRLGSLKELFGVLQQSAGDARGQFENSLTSLQYPDRGIFLTELAEKMGSTSKLATLEEIERLWFELQREMTESGKVSRFKTKVVTVGGATEEREVIRVGVFNAISEGKYLQYTPETGSVGELIRQPKDRFVNAAQELQSAQSGLVKFGLDPSRGQILSLVIRAPTREEQIEQGGVVGKIIIALGLVAVLIAALKLLWTVIVSIKVAAQMRNLDNPSKGNPLGRVLQAYHDHRNIDVESLELRLSEAVLKETPGINRFNMALKVIAVVAPLLGLLGTVTGMIVTFQMITLFGTGDPKLMAGGISQALVTTKFGLMVAIPTVFLHAFVSGR